MVYTMIVGEEQKQYYYGGPYLAGTNIVNKNG